MNELQGIDSYCGLLNFGGLVKIEYAPTLWIDESSFRPIISSSWNFQNEILFLTGDWLTVHLLSLDNIWNEDERRSKQGKYYPQRIAGIAPNLRPEVSGEFDRMADHTFILKITDKNKRVWLIGTPETPLEFKAPGTSGKGSQKNAYQIQFTGNTLHRAYGYQPV